MVQFLKTKKIGELHRTTNLNQFEPWVFHWMGDRYCIDGSRLLVWSPISSDLYGYPTWMAAYYSHGIVPALIWSLCFWGPHQERTKSSTCQGVSIYHPVRMRNITSPNTKIASNGASASDIYGVLWLHYLMIGQMRNCMITWLVNDHNMNPFFMIFCDRNSAATCRLDWKEVCLLIWCVRCILACSP